MKTKRSLILIASSWLISIAVSYVSHQSSPETGSLEKLSQQFPPEERPPEKPSEPPTEENAQGLDYGRQNGLEYRGQMIPEARPPERGQPTQMPLEQRPPASHDSKKDGE